MLVHGYPLSRSIWVSQRALTDRYRVVAPDLPGFGKNSSSSFVGMEHYADALARLMDFLGISRASVFGHSMGGYVVLALAERNPDRLTAAGLIGSHPFADTPEAREGRLKMIERVQREGTGIVISAMLDKLLSPNRTDSANLQSRLREIMESASIEGILTALQGMAERPDRSGVLKTSPVPWLIAAGSDDPFVAADRLNSMGMLAPTATLRTIPRSGHMPMMEEPEILNQVFREFLSSLDLSVRVPDRVEDSG